ncbi:MAG: undecaprenyl-diphosphate phosphatase [Candidatus Omnitrophica bacterium]|nr:undecaprenyl-diphosphate phosphatase [Candidatus Omnitrophota bacterium]
MRPSGRMADSDIPGYRYDLLMSMAEAIISGVVQGITEFLPISSSGHLALLHGFFHLSEPDLFFDICLHAGTLAAVIVYFGRDMISIIRERKIFLVSCIAAATVPAVVAALFFEERITLFFADPRKVAFMFIVTGLALFAGQFGLRPGTRQRRDPTLTDSLFIGIAQAFALLPGISRSGVTISTGLVRGVRKEAAFSFSFLLSIPAIVGAVLYKGVGRIRGGAVLTDAPANYIAGMAAAFIVGILSLPLLLKVIRTKRLYVFGIYCLLLGLSGIFLW